MSKELTVKSLFTQNDIQKRFEDLLGKKAQGFITSVLQIVSNSGYLSKADPLTVLNAAATAATLDLPINQNLGFAWIVPYKGQAQFQMGWKGYVQLALRTGQYARINVTPIHENQFKSWNNLTESLEGDFSLDGEGKIVGYAGYFKLTNGFEKTVYWSHEKVEKHAKRFSKSYTNGPWKTDFVAMALKTVLKAMISKWGIMSIQLQTAVVADQSVQKNAGDYNYIDNDNKDEDGNTIVLISNADLALQIEEAKDKTELDKIAEEHKPEIVKNINLIELLGKKRKSFENGQ